MCIAGMTMLKSGAELETPLVELVTYPLAAQRVLGASKILQPLQGWAGELQKSSALRHAQLRARHGRINFRRIAVKSNASRGLTRRRDRQQEYEQCS